MDAPNIIIGKKSSTLWISEKFLLSVCKELTEDYLRKRVRQMYLDSVPIKQRDKPILPITGRSWRFSKQNGTFYYDYSFIPDKSPQNYRSKLPQEADLRELRKNESIKAQVDTKDLENVVETALKSDYIAYMPLYSGLSKAKELAQAASIMQSCLGYIEDSEIDIKKNAFFILLAEILTQKDVKYLPQNHRRLKQKFIELVGGANNVTDDSEAITDVTEIIKMPRLGNSNAQKITDEEIKAWAMILRAKPQNYTNAHIIRQVQLMCQMHEKTTPSESWFAKLFASHETKSLTASGRFGNSRHGQRYRAYNPIERPLFAGDCWEMDGSRIQLISWKEKDESTGKFKEKFLYVVVVRDVFSRAVLGYCFCLNESAHVYTMALKMAVQSTGYLPYELVTDKFPGHKTEEWKTVVDRINKLGTKVTVGYSAEAKASTERWFGTLQTVFFQSSPYYYGEGIKSSRAFAHREADMLLKLKQTAHKEGWNFDASVKDAEDCFNAYNTTALSYYSKKYAKIEQSPLELHEKSEKSGTMISQWQTAYALMLQKKVQVRNMMLKTQIEGAEYMYDIPPSVVDKFESVLISYDLENLDKVWLFCPQTEKYLGEGTTKALVKRYGKDANYSGLQEGKARAKQIAETRKDKLKEFSEKVDINEVNLLLAGKLPKAEVEAEETKLLLKDIGSTGNDTQIDDDDDTEFDANAFRRGAY